MIRQVLQNAGLTLYPTIGLVVFGLFFLCVLLWLYRKNSKTFYKNMSTMIFDTFEKDQIGKHQRGGNV